MELPQGCPPMTIILFGYLGVHSFYLIPVAVPTLVHTDTKITLTNGSSTCQVNK
jgi:hypothetical protein